LAKDQISASILPCMLRCSLPCSCLKQHLIWTSKASIVQLHNAPNAGTVLE
jgi:hypothetical protein